MENKKQEKRTKVKWGYLILGVLVTVLAISHGNMFLLFLGGAPLLTLAFK